jgi:C4-type Zn-finger protein
MMEKHGVVTDDSLEKKGTADDGKVRCPVCGAECDTSGTAPKCPTHGTEPFEKG